MQNDGDEKMIIALRQSENTVRAFSRPRIGAITPDGRLVSSAGQEDALFVSKPIEQARRGSRSRS